MLLKNLPWRWGTRGDKELLGYKVYVGMMEKFCFYTAVMYLIPLNVHLQIVKMINIVYIVPYPWNKLNFPCCSVTIATYLNS